MKKALMEKLKESVLAVIPITVLVLLLCCFFPINLWMIMAFIIGALMLIVGLSLFNLGADSSMMRLGEDIGQFVTKKKNIWLLLGVTAAIGLIITIAEPDLMVLAEQLKDTISPIGLIIIVAVGVGIFLALALLRIVLQIKLNLILIVLYALVFLIAIFVPKEFIAVAFDSGGVTTGPMTVPFILALGLGVAGARGSTASKDDSFGLVSFCSIGPVLMVLIIGLFIDKPSVNSNAIILFDNGQGFLKFFGQQFLSMVGEISLAILPIIICVVVFKCILLKDNKKAILKMFIGLLYTYIGLIIFLTGAHIGFMPIANILGETIGSKAIKWILIPLGMLMGFFVVMAEPAVNVLNKQVEELTSGSISKKTMLFSMAFGVAISIGLSMMRVVFDFSIWWILIPGYLIAIVLMFFVPKIFTAIAFDSGGVASGPMTATFLLPLASGACLSIYDGDAVKMLANGFGVVALVAMTPLIVVQIVGLVYAIKTKIMARNVILDVEPIIEFEIDYQEMEEKANE